MSVGGNLPFSTHRYGLFVSYLGTKFNGSQRMMIRGKESTEATVQEAIESSLEKFIPQKHCRLTGSSRTDKGVHALMNCFTLPIMHDAMPTEKLKRLANHHLARKLHDISINEVLLLPIAFHPQKSALSREYIYRIACFNPNQSRLENLAIPSAPSDLMHMLPITELYRVLPVHSFNVDKAIQAIDILSGEHNFASFAFRLPENQNPIRSLKIDLHQMPINAIIPCSHPFNIYHIHFKSRAFLHNQIRRMVGAILSYASYDRITLNDIKKLLENPGECKWPAKIPIAHPYGLFLSKLNFDPTAFQGSLKTHEDSAEELVDRYEEASESSNN